MSNTNVNSLFAGAVQSGDLSMDALASLMAGDLGTQIQEALGTPAEHFAASEAFCQGLLFDDSSSMSGMTSAVLAGHKLFVDALRGSGTRDDVLMLTTMFNRGLLHPFISINNVPVLDDSNYRAYGQTPLYDRTIELLGTMIAKEREFADQGIPVRTCTLIVTDGADYGSHSRASDVAKIVADMQRAESHIIMGMGIDDGGHTDFRKVFHEMGIKDEWILTPSNDESSIRRAMAIASRASATASQGAASFSQAMGGGFAS